MEIIPGRFSFEFSFFLNFPSFHLKYDTLGHYLGKSREFIARSLYGKKWDSEMKKSGTTRSQ